MKFLFLLFFYFISFFLSTKVFSAEFLIKDLSLPDHKQSSWIILPYAFSSDKTGFAAGIVGLWSGLIQPQVSIVSTIFSGEKMDIEHGEDAISETKRTKGAFIAINGYRPIFLNRLFITASASYVYYPHQWIYVDGSNNSKNVEENINDKSLTPLKTQGENSLFITDFRYVLPWGESKSKVLPQIQLRKGIAVNRGDIGGGKPFVSGQTIFGTGLFYDHITADKFIDKPQLNSNGLRFYLDHNNTDYPTNPSRGYRFKGQMSIDFGLGSSTQSWNALEFDYSHFIELPNFSWSRQSVIAFNYWTAYSPSWDKSQSFTEHLDKHEPPMWEGARLGGWNRMRAYDSNRFSDKAAIYGAAEYRIIPGINPFGNLQWNPIAIDWFQIVLFAEVGRVAPEYSLTELFSEMKYDAGFSIRALAAKIPIRLDMAFGKEGSNMWVMFNQPF
ncbi:MAG: BamA/TamA family outer membrane protein [Psychromonas sp.]|nr:BamA/TamA family outer membrane protein [Psychromonas sp.]